MAHLTQCKSSVRCAMPLRVESDRGLAPPLHPRSPSLDHHCHTRTVLLFHTSSSSLLRHHPAIPSLRRTASKPLCSLPVLVEAAPYPTWSPLRGHRWISYAPVCSTCYCSPFPVTLLLFFWHPLLLTFRLSSLVLCSFAFRILRVLHPLLFACFPFILVLSPSFIRENLPR